MAALRSEPAIETMPASNDGILEAHFGAEGYQDAKANKLAVDAENARIKKASDDEAAREKAAADAV